MRHNVTLVADPFAVPPAIRAEKTDVQPIASQWILRRVAGNVSYQDLGRTTPIDFVRLADGVFQIQGSSHNTVIVEMRDYLVAIEGPLYEARTAPVIKAIKERYPNKPIRYVIPTHHHLDHAGGIRAFMAEGATIVAPVMATEFYLRVAKSPHTIAPDSLEKTGRAFAIDSHGGYYVLDDGNRRIEVYRMPTSHEEDLQVI